MTGRVRLCFALCCSLALVMAVLAGCADLDPATQLVVVVNSDIPAEELRYLAVSVEKRGSSGRLEMTTQLAEAPSGDIKALPLSFAIVPASHAPTAPVLLRITGSNADREVVATRALSVGFVAGQARLLAADLLRPCHPRQESGIEEVDVDDLPLAEPGRELHGVERLPPRTSDEVCEGSEPVAADTKVDAETATSYVGDAQAQGTDGGDSATPTSDGGMDAGFGGDANTPTPVADADADALSGDAATAADESCGRSGFWRGVERSLTKNLRADVCALGTQGVFYPKLGDHAEAARLQLQLALGSRVDVIEWNVGWSDGVRVFGVQNALDTGPSLRSLLGDEAFKQSKVLLKLFVSEAIGDPDSFAQQLLNELSAIQTDYARACRPLFLTSTGGSSAAALKRLRQLLAAPEHAGLRSRLRYGVLLESGVPAILFSGMSRAVADGNHYVELEGRERSSLVWAAREAHKAGLGAFARNVLQSPWAPSLCGLIDLVQMTVDGDNAGGWVMDVEDSRPWLELDTSAISSQATAFDYYSGLSLGGRVYTLGATGQPTLGVPVGLAATAGSYLLFDGTQRQSVELTLLDFTVAEFALYVQVKSGAAVPEGQYQTLVTNRNAGSGFWLELKGAEVGHTRVRFGLMLRDDSGLMPSTAEVEIDGFESSERLIHATYRHGHLSLTVDGLYTSTPAVAGDPVGNSEPIRVGSALDGGQAYTGAVQMLRLHTFEN